MGIVTKIDDMGIAAFSAALKKAEPKLSAALARHGVTSPEELPPEVAQKIFQDALLQTAVENFPDAQIDALKHGFATFQHPRFAAAFSKAKERSETRQDAFEMASGADAAIVLAGFGLPIAPFDRKMPRILSEPSNKIDLAVESFSRWKTAYVGYSPCDIPFYMIVTDCIKTMQEQLMVRPELAEAKRLFLQAGGTSQTRPVRDFQHGIVLVPREPMDTASTVFLNNPNPRQGSVGFYAGWAVAGVRHGAPNDGFLPVPAQFLSIALRDPQIATWIWKPVGTKVILN